MYNLQPYIKNVQILKCPDDSLAGVYSWAGPRVSYASNGLIKWDGSAWSIFGVMGIAQAKADGGWMGNVTQTLAGVGRSAETVMIGEKLAAENQLWFGPFGVISGIPNSWGWGNSEIPDATRNPSYVYPQGYPEGPTGGITPVHNLMSNFVLCDGHSKAMRPAATDPDPVHQPQNNMWDATRQ